MKTIILGFDAFDPTFFEGLHNAGKTPNLSKLLEAGGYSPFQVAAPPQSEVSWTSIATGLNPGSHGLFDFVHRNPADYQLQVSLLPTQKGIGGTQFTRPYTTKTIFDIAAEKGFPATSMWWPATFPARIESPVRTIPGLGTPDIQGRLGVGSLYSSDPGAPEFQGKTPVFQLRKENGSYRGELYGPKKMTGAGEQEMTATFEITISSENQALLRIGKTELKLQPGQWSDIFEVGFKAGFLMNIPVVTRAIITTDPDLQIYFLPLQLQPLKSPWRYGTTKRFIKDVWQGCGPYLTIGWPQDTTGLEDSCLTDAQFLSLCDDIFASRVCALRQQIAGFKEGLLAVVFDSLDRIQHMFWHSRPDIIESWYLKLDRLVGDVQSWIQASPAQQARLVIASDHGFSDFHHKVHLNRWLQENGYLSHHQSAPHGDFKDINWSQTRAYAIGLNSLYLNLQGREAQGSANPTEAEKLTHQLRDRLLGWRAPSGEQVISQVLFNHQAFHGPLAVHGPDLLIGFSPGHRASQDAGMGSWKETAIEPNMDHWGADHCIDSTAVPGTLFTNFPLVDYPSPTYEDFPSITIDVQPETPSKSAGPILSEGDDKELEERLKSLGYL